MLRLRRSTVAALAAATLLTAPAATALAAGSASAAPHAAHAAHSAHSAHAAHGRADQRGPGARGVLREIAAKDRYLARLTTSRAFKKLADDQEATLTVSITADRATLATLADAVKAGTTAVRDARTQLRALRVENYQRAVALLNAAARLLSQSPSDANLQAMVDDLVTAALGIDASSTRADLKAAGSLLNAAADLLDSLLDALLGGGSGGSTDGSTTGAS